MGVRIYWTANGEPDMEKYKIYRQVITTGVITYLDEVLHPTAEYIDAEGDSSYRYFVSAVDTAGNESAMAGPVRLPPSGDLCQIYDNLRDAKGNMLAEVQIAFTIVELPLDYNGSLWSGATVKATTNTSGNFEIFLPRSAKVLILQSDLGINVEKTVPDQDSIRLGDWIANG